MADEKTDLTEEAAEVAEEATDQAEEATEVAEEATEVADEKTDQAKETTDQKDEKTDQKDGNKEQRYALLVDYTYHSGNHSAEIGCKEELGLPLEQFGIKEVQVGPFKKREGNNDGDNWEWFYIPCPTSIFSEHWGTGGDKAGQRPLACQVEEGATMYYGTVEEMQAKMAEFDRRMVLFQL